MSVASAWDQPARCVGETLVSRAATAPSSLPRGPFPGRAPRISSIAKSPGFWQKHNHAISKRFRMKLRVFVRILGNLESSPGGGCGVWRVGRPMPWLSARGLGWAGLSTAAQPAGVGVRRGPTGLAGLPTQRRHATRPAWLGFPRHLHTPAGQCWSGWSNAIDAIELDARRVGNLGADECALDWPLAYPQGVAPP